MKFYVAAGMYPMGTKEEFHIVREASSRGLPYVWPEIHPQNLDSATLFNTTKHHASQYLVSQDGKTLTLTQNGERRNHDPQTHTMTAEEQAVVKAIIAKALRQLAIPESECPNCENGTISLEQGRLVCRGECGNDFGEPA